MNLAAARLCRYKNLCIKSNLTQNIGSKHILFSSRQLLHNTPSMLQRPQNSHYSHFVYLRALKNCKDSSIWQQWQTLNERIEIAKLFEL